MKVGAVNADEHKSLSGRFGVRGFPTVKIFTPTKKEGEDYRGGRTAQGLAEAALNALKERVDEKLGSRSGKKVHIYFISLLF